MSIQSMQMPLEHMGAENQCFKLACTRMSMQIPALFYDKTFASVVLI